MRLPNGYGSIVKLSGNRRRPYMVRKTIGYDKNHRQIYSVLGYHPTRDDALIALAHYNQEDVPVVGITLAKVFQAWFPMHSKLVSETTVESYQNSYNHLLSIMPMPIDKIKYRHIQAVIDKMRSDGLSYSSCKKVRSLVNMLYDYAAINEWCSKSYGKHLQLGTNTPVHPHKPFTRRQINRVWACSLPETDVVLLLLYTGMRSKELRTLQKKNVNRKQKYFDIVESKTKAGVRIIPIHPRIQPIVDRLLQQDGKYLLGPELSYAQLSTKFNRVMAAIRAKHSTHDCRHTVATLLDAADANPNAVRMILGHAGGNVTDAVYTHKSLPQLRRAIQCLR